jgi:hypothetical protein
MKQIRTSRTVFSRLIVPAMVLAIGIGFSSCKKDESLKPAPSVTVTPTTASNVAGAAVTASVQVDSPEGGATLKILVNGAANTALPDVALDGSASQTVPISFTIPATATVGASYIIQFQAIDMKNQNSLAGTFAVTVSAVPAKTIVDVQAGNITTNTTWTKDKIWRLNGFVRIGMDAKPTSPTTTEMPVISNPTTLTIEAGTVIYGKTGTPGGTLIVQRGSQIIANGTAAAPIIFTSEKAPSTKKAGDWGGVVLCGQAKNNVIGSLSTGGNGVEELEGGYGAYHGGTSDTDNSGSLKYVRIEYAGYPINPNQEINGLTLGSVGSGTTLQFIQVTYANDDSFEWFGGAVNASNLIAYKGIDDDFDTDNGFSGKVQFGLGIRDQGIADQSGSNGFESDNDANGSTNLPVTTAQFSNMTILGGKATVGTGLNGQFQNGAQIRRNSEMDIYNSIITGYPNGIFIDGQRPTASPQGSGGSVAKANAGLIVLKNNIIAGVDGWGGNGYGRVANADEIANVTAVTGSYPFTPNQEYNGSTTVPPRGRLAYAGDGAFASGVFGPASGATEQTVNGVVAVAWLKANNDVISRWTDSGLNANNFEPLNGTPTLIPAAGSKLASGADFTGLSGFTVVTYRGAFGTTDWTTGWVNWNPQGTDYSK